MHLDTAIVISRCLPRIGRPLILTAAAAPAAVSKVMKQAPLGRPVAKSLRTEMGFASFPQGEKSLVASSSSQSRGKYLV